MGCTSSKKAADSPVAKKSLPPDSETNPQNETKADANFSSSPSTSKAEPKAENGNSSIARGNSQPIDSNNTDNNNCAANSGVLGSENFPKLEADCERLALKIKEIEDRLEKGDFEPVEMNNKITYCGEWKNGKPHGIGQHKEPSGLEYIGEFDHGVMTGFGTLKRPDGSVYKGEFSCGKANTAKLTVGLYQYPDGSEYKGQWQNDLRHGFGKETTADGTYEGEYKNGVKNGKGKMIADLGETYSGDYVNGEMNGEGKYTWPDGRVYDGSWVSGRMQGNGKFQFADGRLYDGQFEASKMQGKGKLMWPDGSCYEGEFKAGFPHGKGRHTPKNGTTSALAEWNQGVRVKWLEETPATETS